MVDSQMKRSLPRFTTEFIHVYIYIYFLCEFLAGIIYTETKLSSRLISAFTWQAFPPLSLSCRLPRTDPYVHTSRMKSDIKHSSQGLTVKKRFRLAKPDTLFLPFRSSNLTCNA